MAMTNINVRTDSEIKSKAQQIFASLGLDMSTAVNIFLRQTVRQNDLPFVLTAQPKLPKAAFHKELRPPFKFGFLNFKISEDFDEPLDDFKEYM